MSEKISFKVKEKDQYAGTGIAFITAEGGCATYNQNYPKLGRLAHIISEFNIPVLKGGLRGMHAS